MREDGSLSSAAFNNTGGENVMSVDWSERATSRQTLDRFDYWPKGKYVVSLTAQDYWSLCQRICFAPTTENPAHTHIVGKKTTKVKRGLLKRAQEIKFSEDRIPGGTRDNSTCDMRGPPPAVPVVEQSPSGTPIDEKPQP